MYEMIKPYVILFIVLIVLIVLLDMIVKITSIYENISQRRAYDLIAEEEELTIKYLKDKESRERRIDEEKLKLIEAQVHNERFGKK